MGTHPTTRGADFAAANKRPRAVRGPGFPIYKGIETATIYLLHQLKFEAAKKRGIPLGF